MLTELLAKFFQTFKTKNPKVFGIIALVLIALFAAVQNPIFSEIFGTSAATNKIIEVLTFLVAVIAGTHTSEITNKK